MALGAGLLVLAVLAYGVWEHYANHDLSPWITPAIALAFVVTAVPSFLDQAPRLVLAPEGLAWRGRQKSPLEFLTWPEIAKAEIVPTTEDAPKTLRLTLPRTPLESVASEDRKAKVDIDIGEISLSDSRLADLIHDLAPHLFGRRAKD